MNRTDKIITELPDMPGVYLFYEKKGSRKKILYVGKATSLRDRVRSYFDDDLIATRGPRVVDMVTKASGVDHEVTPTVLEALVREASLIKKYKPKANVEGKDDKSFLFCVITKEEIPRVMLVRGKDIDTKAKQSPYGPYKSIYGPFPSGAQLKEALRIIRRIFPFYDAPRPIAYARLNKHIGARIEFDRQIGKSPRDVAIKDYQKTIKKIELFLSGETVRLRKEIHKEMLEQAKEQRFEEADIAKRQLYALDHVNDVSLLKNDTSDEASVRRLEAYDVAHIGGTNAVGVMVVFQNGEPDKKEYRTFLIRGVRKNDDIASLREILTRRFSHTEWEFPTAIVVDGGKTHLDFARRTLREMHIPVAVTSVVKDKRHRPKGVLNAPGSDALPKPLIVRANAEAHRFALSTHKKKRAKIYQGKK